MERKYSIGEVSKICSIPIKTLRYYDEIGLMVPEFRNEESRYRYYSKKQMVNLFIIRQLRTLGFSLKNLKELFLDSHLKNLDDMIRERLDEIDEEIQELETKRTAAVFLRDRIRKGDEILSHYDEDFDSARGDSLGLINVEYIEKGTLYFRRGIMKKYRNEEVSLERWIDITESCQKRHLTVTSPIIVTYFDNVLDQYLGKDCDVEFGVLVEKDQRNYQDNVEKKCIRPFGGFDAVTKVHVGSYRNIMVSHVRMVQWINQNDYEIAGPISEEFIVSPVDIDNEDEHITKIIIPVKKRKEV